MPPNNKTQKKNSTFGRRRSFGAGILGACLALAVLASPQNQASLQISSPSNGAAVPAGQSLSITVTSPAGLSFQMVAVNGADPIGFNGASGSVPAQFSIAIPADADAGPCTLTANGVTQSGQQVVSAPIQVDIERSDPPASLSTLDSSSVVLESVGEQVHSVILARFADGSIVDVTRSTLVSFASSNTAVATVDSSGTVTAQSPGSATINVTYTLGSQSLQVPIPVTVKTPKLTVSPSSLTFASQATGTSSQAQQLTITNAAADAVSVLSVAPNGDFSETDNCVASSPLAAGGTCVANVSFSPLVIGARAGTLSIANSANNASMVVALTGTGIASGPSHIVLVQHTSQDAGTETSSLTLSFGSNNSAGNFIAVIVRAGSSGEVVTVTDSNGNTYKKAVQLDVTLDTPEGHTLAIYYAENIAGGPNTVTVSDSVYATLRFAILEYSGVAISQSLDVTAATQGSSTSANSGSATTTTNGELLLGGISTADAEDLAAGSGYTAEEVVPTAPNTKLIAEDQLQTATGAISASGSLLDYSDPWGAVLATFKPAGH